MAGHARKSVRLNFFVPRQLSYVVQHRAFCVSKLSAGAVLIERVEFRFLHHRFDGEGAADIDAEKAEVEARHLLADEQDSLWRQGQLLVELADFCVKQTEGCWQSCGMHFYRSQDFAELLARKVIGQLQHEAAGFFDWGKERIRWSIHFGNYSSIFSFPNKKNVRTKIAPRKRNVSKASRAREPAAPRPVSFGVAVTNGSPNRFSGDDSQTTFLRVLQAL